MAQWEVRGDWPPDQKALLHPRFGPLTFLPGPPGLTAAGSWARKRGQWLVLHKTQPALGFPSLAYSPTQFLFSQQSPLLLPLQTKAETPEKGEEKEKGIKKWMGTAGMTWNSRHV